jgi:hypothetical protein
VIASTTTRGNQGQLRLMDRQPPYVTRARAR